MFTFSWADKSQQTPTESHVSLFTSPLPPSASLHFDIRIQAMNQIIPSLWLGDMTSIQDQAALEKANIGTSIAVFDGPVTKPKVS